MAGSSSKSIREAVEDLVAVVVEMVAIGGGGLGGKCADAGTARDCAGAGAELTGVWEFAPEKTSN